MEWGWQSMNLELDWHEIQESIKATQWIYKGLSLCGIRDIDIQAMSLIYAIHGIDIWGQPTGGYPESECVADTIETMLNIGLCLIEDNTLRFVNSKNRNVVYNLFRS
jgi:hypothetical protein